jgi:hypothetical protein
MRAILIPSECLHAGETYENETPACVSSARMRPYMRIAFHEHGLKSGNSLSIGLQKLICLAVPLTPFSVSAVHPISLHFPPFFFLSTSTFLYPLFIFL